MILNSLRQKPKAKPIKGLISFARNVGKDVEEVALARYPANRELVSKIDQFFDGYTRTKLARGLTDYDDLLVFWLTLMEKHQEAENIFKTGFPCASRRYQDVNSLQQVSWIGSPQIIKLWR